MGAVSAVCVRVGRKCILVARTASRGKLDIIAVATHYCELDRIYLEIC